MCRPNDRVPMLDKAHLPYRVAAAYLLERLTAAGLAVPSVGVICGSGLSGLSATLQGKTLTVKYSDIPGFPAHCTVAGHKGEVVFGLLSGDPAVCFRGRFHSYEGHDMKTVVLPVHVMRCLNVKAVVITNAAGGLNPSFRVGDVVCITDHLALPHIAGKNSLVGPNDDELGPRFPPTSNAYNPALPAAVVTAAETLGFDFVVPSGTYCFVSGPMYESKSESRFLRQAGGDCVGMSTIPEVIAAHHCGMQVLCLSLVTNKVIQNGDEGPAASHAEVLEAVQKRSVQMQALVKQVIAELNKSVLPSLPDLPPIELKHAKMQYEREHRVDSTGLGDDAVRKSSSDKSSVPSMPSIAAGAFLFVAGSLTTLLFTQRRR